MYELFVLGELMTGSLHGYLLQERLKQAVGPVRQISSGTLYPLLSRLTESGWISLRHDDQQEGGRPRKIYELTDAGRTRFEHLMVYPLEFNADTELVFHFKLVYFQFISKDIQLACLEQYLNYLQFNVNYVNTALQMISQKQLDEKKRIQILRMLDHRKHLGLADMEWVKEEIIRIGTIVE